MTAVKKAVLLETHDLVKEYPIRGSHNVVHACSAISLQLKVGETLGIIGESGSGKTTFGRCLLRLVEPTSGSIVFEGVDITRAGRTTLRNLRRDMQIVFQEPFDSMNPQMTIGRQITEPLRIHTSMSKSERRDRAQELLRLVGLPPAVADTLPRTMSPGALQRASIARAIATDPKLIVLDEPTSALAPEAEVEIIRLLKDLQERLGLAYVFISHDLALVRQVCDQVAVMYLSQVVESGDAAAVFADPQHPYSRALLASVLTPDPNSPRDRSEHLQGEIPSPIDLPRGCFLASRCQYVTDRCRTEAQALTPLGSQHTVRCWRAAAGEIAPLARAESR